MTKKAFYDPKKTYDDNFNEGPTKTGREVTTDNVGKPDFSFLGKKIYSPFGIPAGPLLNSDYVKYAFENGFDVVCYKTQRSGAFPCNPFPNVLYVDIDGDLTLEEAQKPKIASTKSDRPVEKLTITNSFAMPSKGPGYWVKDLQKALSYQGKGQLLIMSVVGTIKDGFSKEDYWNDFAEVAQQAASTDVEAIEINLSCPNVATEGVICYDHDAVVNIIKRVRKVTGDTPLIIKLGYFSKGQQALLEKIVLDVSPNIAGISVINTIEATNLVSDPNDPELVGFERKRSGTCGAGVKWAGLDMVKRLADMRKKLNLKYEIIGVGRVMTADDFKNYRDAGADLVQSATGAMWNPSLAKEIKETL